jgi:hypothetical protein
MDGSSIYRGDICRNASGVDSKYAMGVAPRHGQTARDNAECSNHQPDRRWLGGNPTNPTSAREPLMRVVGSVDVSGISYQAVWGSLSSIDNREVGSGNALAVRGDEGTNQTIIRRNAKLADVQASLRHLRRLGLNDSQLSKLFAYKGHKSGLPQHVKVLVSRLN